MRILVPVDESPRSIHLVEFIAGRKTLLGGDCEVEFLNIQSLPSMGLARVFGEDAVKQVYLEEGEKIIEAIRPMAEAKGFRFRTKVVMGDIGEVLPREVKEFGADMILMGSRGLGPVRGFFLGSFSNAVMSTVKIPVLLIRDATADIGDTMRVGIAVDGSHYGRTASEYVLRHRALFGKAAKFCFINVSNRPGVVAMTPESIDEVENEAQRAAHEKVLKDEFELLNLQELADFEKAGVPYRLAQLKGLPAESIARYALENLDVLVMGTHGRDNFKAAVMGSVAMYVGAKTSIPILIVPSAED